MFDSDDVELALYAFGEGMSQLEAGRLVGARLQEGRRGVGRRPPAPRPCLCKPRFRKGTAVKILDQIGTGGTGEVSLNWTVF